MKPVTFTEAEVKSIILALDITESSWEFFELTGRVRAQPEGTKIVLDSIRGKLAVANVEPWDGRATPPPEDDLGFAPDGMRDR